MEYFGSIATIIIMIIIAKWQDSLPLAFFLGATCMEFINLFFAISDYKKGE